jgi:hypothetical protein
MKNKIKLLIISILLFFTTITMINTIDNIAIYHGLNAGIVIDVSGTTYGYEWQGEPGFFVNQTN